MLHEVREPGADSPSDGDITAFWRRHVDSGVGFFVLGSLALLVYFLLTPQGPNRTALEVLAGGSIACWVLVFAPLGRRIVATGWRRAFFMAWSLSTLVVLATAIGLDGGSTTPLAVLLVLPVLFAALAYGPFDVGVIALLAELAYVLIVAIEPGSDASRSFVTALMLALAGGMSWMASLNRLVRERARARLEARLHVMATRDGLTGCLTYRAFRAALEAEVVRARRYLRPFSLILVDLDSFKSINDTYGHHVGDAIVRGVARALRTGARAPDAVGRVGGDEFAILLPETTSVRVAQVARRLQMQVRRSPLPVAVTVSLGTATWFGPGDDLEDVVRRADQALYAAKHAGRDRLFVWENLESVSESERRFRRTGA